MANQVVLHGALTYGEARTAVRAVWPNVDLVVFVDDHIYWKEGRGELSPSDPIGSERATLTLHDALTGAEAMDSFHRSFGTNAEIYECRGSRFAILVGTFESTGSESRRG